jgi:hypothetical protein
MWAVKNETLWWKWFLLYLVCGSAKNEFPKYGQWNLKNETIADPTFALKYTTSINIHDGASAAAAAEVEGEILSINEASCTVFFFFF